MESETLEIFGLLILLKDSFNIQDKKELWDIFELKRYEKIREGV